jgi:hypothetical protein
MAIVILKHPAELIMAHQPISFTLQSDASQSPMRISGGVQNIAGDSVQADYSNKATFELSDYLQGMITERGKTASTPVIYVTTPKVVSFVFQEYVGNPFVSGPVTQTNSYYLLDGYIPKSRRKAFYASNPSLLSYLKCSKSCLSWWPDNESKKVLPEQQEFINYLQVFSRTDISITLNLVLVFTDGTTSNRGAVFTFDNVFYMGLIYFPTGYTQLGIAAMAAAYTDKTLSGYKVSVNFGPPNHSEQISKVYNYILDRSWYQNPRYLWIKNPFGLWEVLLCCGSGQQENSIKPEIVSTDGQFQPDKLTWKTVKSDVVKVNTGFLTAAQMQWLSDLIETTEAYELINGNLHSIVFRDISLPVVHDGEFQYSADLEYEYAYNEFNEQG